MATDRPHIPVVQPHSPTRMGWGTGVQPPSARRLGRGNAHHSFPPPRLPTRALHSSHSRPRSWPGQSPGRTGGCGKGKGRRRQPDVCTLHQRGQASQSPIHSVPSHHVPQVWSTRTHPAPLPQLEPLGRRQRQYRDEGKVPVSTDHLRVHLQRHGY